jgi:D-alanyl-D-alanine carboxypeptidase
MANLKRAYSICLAAMILAGVAGRASAQSEPALAPDVRSKIDSAVREVLKTTGAPSASIAVVKDGSIVYLQAYGSARLDPKTPARADMRYSIGSISKQFTATAVLMLAEQKQLSLDDPVSRFLPTLTRANEVTIRELLSHTSGYQDYWPQDYVPPFMTHPITAEKILDIWAQKPLDFEPGTDWQYSNTGFVAAGLIVEKASGEHLLDFLADHVFKPLAMESVVNVDQGRLTESDPIGYLRYALGPLRPAPKEGKGWLFAAGELAMTAQDLARWDIGMIERKLLSPASYREMQTEVLLKNGLGTRYGLGIDVTRQMGRRALEHGGEVSGFTAENLVFPDDRAAVVVLVNEDATGAPDAIARKIAAQLFASGDAGPYEARARKIFDGLQRGKIDRALFTDNGNSYFSKTAIADFASSLAPLGRPQEFRQTARRDRGGMRFRAFEVKFPKTTLEVTERDMPDGKIEQYQVAAKEN